MRIRPALWRRGPRASLLAGLLVLTTACALPPGPSTQIGSITRDPAFNTALLRRVLVIGVLPDFDRRRLFEDTVARTFRQHRNVAVCSYEHFKSLDSVNRTTLEEWVKTKQIDSVLIARLVEKKTVQAYVPGTPREVPPDPLSGPLTYYNESAQTVTSPGYTVDQSVAVLETKLFETRGGTCVWSGRSETLLHGYLDDLIRSYAEVMTHALYAPTTQ